MTSRSQRDAQPDEGQNVAVRAERSEDRVHFEFDRANVNLFWRNRASGRAIIRRSLWHQIMVQPFENRIVKQTAVFELQDPMSFVWKIKQTRIDALPFERCKELQPLIDRHAK